MLKLGSLCSGGGMLDAAVEAALSAETVWHCEINDAASRVLEYRYPGIPNHRDLTTTDWGAVEPIDILTGGYPCQPFSHAGQRKGADDERHIWPAVRDAIRRLRPRITLLENVAGHRSLGFDRVLGDLAEDGMHVRWTSLRAADIGAPHGRERLFIVVTPNPSDGTGDRQWACPKLGQGDTPSANARDGRESERAWPERRQGGQRPPVGAIPRCGGDNTLLATPQARDYKGVPADGFNTANLCRDVALLQTPSVADALGGHLTRSGVRGDEPLLPGQARDMDGQQWGKYAPAIARWEQIRGPAPSPTEPNRVGKPRLAPAFSEWMMGWPAGWVTGVPGLSRNDQLRIIGNGVVPQCASAALSWLLELEVAA